MGAKPRSRGSRLETGGLCPPGGERRLARGGTLPAAGAAHTYALPPRPGTRAEARGPAVQAGWGSARASKNSSLWWLKILIYYVIINVASDAGACL